MIRCTAHPDVAAVAIAPGSEPVRIVGITVAAGEPVVGRCWACWCMALGAGWVAGKGLAAMTARWNYLASPYTDYVGGIDAAAHEAACAAGLLLDAGIPVFSPIVHFHEIRRVIGARPHEFWMAADAPFMEAADSLIVLELDGWQYSQGVKIEIRHFLERGRPIAQMKPGIVPARFLP